MSVLSFLWIRQQSRSLSSGTDFISDKADVLVETIEETPWFLNILLWVLRESVRNFSRCGLCSDWRYSRLQPSVRTENSRNGDCSFVFGTELSGLLTDLTTSCKTCRCVCLTTDHSCWNSINTIINLLRNIMLRV